MADQPVGSDPELRSAYCVPVLEWQVQKYRQIVMTTDGWEQNAPTRELKERATSLSADMRKTLDSLESALKRVNAYLQSHTQQGRSDARSAARAHGEQDVVEVQAKANQCAAQCGLPEHGVPGNEKEQACVSSCTNQDLVARMRACTSPNWL